MKPDMTRQAPATLADAKAAMAAEMALYRQRILMDYPFTASVMLGLDLVPVRDIRLHTASTDGRKIYYDIAYWRDRPEIRRFVLAHETWHCILVQQRGRTDGVLVMPEDGCYVGWAAYYSE